MAITSHRKALAGVEIAAGATVRAALLRNGFAPSTARAAKRNGLSADQCMDAARDAKLLPAIGYLHERVTRLTDLKLDAIESDPEQLKSTRLGEFARLLQVTQPHEERRPPLLVAVDPMMLAAVVFQALGLGPGGPEQAKVDASGPDNPLPQKQVTDK